MTMRPSCVRFGPFELDYSLHVLTRDSQPIPIQKLPLDVLCYLIEQRERVVAREELLQTVWGGVAVSQGAVSQAIHELRRALGDHAHHTITTIRGRGLRFTGSLERVDSSRPEPADGAPNSDARPRNSSMYEEAASDGLYGRESDLEEVSRIARVVQGGKGQAVAIGGEPGIGKTSLLEALWTVLRQQRFSVHMGRCSEESAAFPYAPWSPTASRILTSPGVVGELDAEQLAQARSLFHSMRIEGATAGEGEGPEVRQRAFTSFGAVLTRHCIRQPVALLFDDLHQSDSASLDLLAHVTQQLAGYALLVVGTYRTTHRTPEARPAWAWVQGAAHRMLLHGLTSQAARAVLAGLLSYEPTEEVAREVMALTGGNPFLLRTAARHLMRNATLTELRATFQVPDRLAAAARIALAGLERPSLTVLEAAAVQGCEVDLGLLGQVLEQSMGELELRLAPCFTQQLLFPIGPGLCRFSHALLARSLYDSQVSAERRQLHERYAQAMQARGLQHVSSLAQSLRHAHLAAHDDRTARDAIAQARTMAQRANQVFACVEAAQYLQDAQGLLHLLNPPDPQLAWQLELERCDAAHGAGDFTEAIRGYAAVAEAARARHHQSVLVAALTRYGVAQKGFGDRRLIRLLQLALEDTSQYSDDELARLLAGYTHALRQTAHCVEARQAGLRAVALARKLADAALLRRSLLALRWVASDETPSSDLLAISNESYQLCRRAGDLWGTTEILIWKICDHLRRGETAAYREALMALDDLANRARYPWIELVRDRYLVMDQVMHGKLGDAVPAANDILRRGQEAGDEVAPIVWALHNYHAAIEQGQFAGLESACRAIDCRMGGNPAWQSMIAVCEGMTGRTVSARETINGLLEVLHPDLLASHYLGTCAVVADAIWECEYREAAPRLSQLLRSYAGLHVCLPAGILYLGPVERCVGRMAWLAGDEAEAEGSLGRALEQCRAIEAEYFIAQTAFELGRLLRRRGSSAAPELLAEAARLASSLGLSRLKRQAALELAS